MHAGYCKNARLATDPQFDGGFFMKFDGKNDASGAIKIPEKNEHARM